MNRTASLRGRTLTAGAAAVAVVVAFWVLLVVVGTLPEAIDQAYWQFAGLAAIVAFLAVLIR